MTAWQWSAWPTAAMLDRPDGREFCKRRSKRFIGSARRCMAHDGLAAGERSNETAPPDG
jgi:hypothetical protein